MAPVKNDECPVSDIVPKGGQLGISLQCATIGKDSDAYVRYHALALGLDARLKPLLYVAWRRPLLQAPRASQAQAMEDHQRFDSRTVLMLEDEVLIALDIEESLNEIGFAKIEIISTCADAEIWLESGNPSVAIVDPGLRDGTCTSAVRRLAAS